MPKCEYGNVKCENTAKIRLLISGDKYWICAGHAEQLSMPIQKVLKDYTSDRITDKLFNKTLKPIKG